MDLLLTRSQLAARGLTDADLARQVSAGEIERVRRGVYARTAADERTVEEQHLLLLAATAPQLVPGTVFSHGSAAVVRGLPVWRETVDHVHVTRPRRGGGRRRTAVYRHASPLDPDEVSQLHGWSVTSLARTVVDVVRTVPLAQGVAAADKALALGLEPVDLELAVARAARWPGAGRARRVAAFADGRSESAGESVSRVILAEQGLPAPEPQLRVYDGARQVARVDFGWPELRTIAEFDGRIKYGRLLERPQDPGEVVFDEKVREDMLRDLGWEVVRWIWADLDRPDIIAARLRRAFLRAARR